MSFSRVEELIIDVSQKEYRTHNETMNLFIFIDLMFYPPIETFTLPIYCILHETIPILAPCAWNIFMTLTLISHCSLSRPHGCPLLFSKIKSQLRNFWDQRVIICGLLSACFIEIAAVWETLCQRKSFVVMFIIKGTYISKMFSLWSEYKFIKRIASLNVLKFIYNIIKILKYMFGMTNFIRYLYSLNYLH